MSDASHNGVRTLACFAAACVVFGLVVYASDKVGVPHDAHRRENLPDISLDWRLLFHVQRATALLAVVGTVGLIAWRGARGEWPIKFGNVEYAPKKAVAVT